MTHNYPRTISWWKQLVFAIISKGKFRNSIKRHFLTWKTKLGHKMNLETPLSCWKHKLTWNHHNLEHHYKVGNFVLTSKNNYKLRNIQIHLEISPSALKIYNWVGKQRIEKLCFPENSYVSKIKVKFSS